MANKRILKKQVLYVCGDIAAECIFAADVVPGIDEQKMGQIVVDLAVLQEQTLQKMNFTFDKAPRDFENRADYNKARAAYYHAAFKSLKNTFNKSIDEIVARMNALLPEEQRRLNKESMKK